MSNMIIKLKMPETTAFECPTCAKAFTTEKGLGSHKKAHMEKKNKRSHETMELQNEENGEKTLAFSCPVCPQSFASEKALHGHMRKHPNRGWRGMKPPVGAENPPPSNLSVALSGGQSSKSAAGENDGKGDSNNNDLKEGKKYLCDKCGMMFRSYQALGGHRSHRGCNGQPSVVNKKGDGGPGSGPGPSSSLVFGFDLNELPPEWHAA